MYKKYKLEDLVSNGSHIRTKIKSGVIVSDLDFGYNKGDILDANSTMELIQHTILSVLPHELFTEVTSENIKDGTIKMEDLSKSLQDTLSPSYNASDETLYLNNNLNLN